jgi:hypothetical protein
MRPRISLPVGLWLAALALGGGAAAAFRDPAAPADAAVTASAAAPALPAATDRNRLRADAAVLRDRDPFRLARAPTAYRVGAPPPLPAFPQATPLAAPEYTPPPAPVQAPLSVSGIVGGPPWQAVLENVPGAGRAVPLAAGEASNGVRVLWIRGDSVAVQTADGTSVLTLKQP